MSETIEQITKNIQQALGQANYDFKMGKPYLFNICTCETVLPAFKNCFGNNPAAPYVIPLVPHFESYPDSDGTTEAYSYGPSMQLDPSDDSVYATFRVRPDEAIMMFGLMPPQGAYLGFETYLFSRQFDRNNPTGAVTNWLDDGYGFQNQISSNGDSILFTKAPKDTSDGNSNDPSNYVSDPNRVLLFTNISNSINSSVLANEIGPDFWQHLAILSVSANADFKTELDEQLAGIAPGYAGRHISNPIGEHMKLGLESGCDDFWIILRYALPADREAGELWRNNLATNLAVLRAKRQGDSPVTRCGTTQFVVKKSNFDEKTLAVDLQKIADQIGKDVQSNGPQEILYPLSNVPFQGDISIPKAMNCLGVSLDTETYRTTSARPLGSDDVWAIVGVNHNKVGNSSYISLGLYDAEQLMGILSVSQGTGPDSGKLDNSVNAYFNGSLPPELAHIGEEQLKQFYIHFFARSFAALPENAQNEELHTIIADGEYNACEPALVPTFPTAKDVRFMQRAYLDPTGTVGTDPTKNLSPILVSFTA